MAVASSWRPFDCRLTTTGRRSIHQPLRSLGARECDAKCRTAAVAVEGFDASLISLGDRLHDDQAQTESLCFGREEGFEQMLPDLRCEAGAIVLHDDFRGVVG